MALQLLGALVVVCGETMVHFFESCCVGIGDACASGLHKIESVRFRGLILGVGMARTGDGERSESFTVVISCCYEAMLSEDDQQTRSDYWLRPLVGDTVISASSNVDG